MGPAEVIRPDFPVSAELILKIFVVQEININFAGDLYNYIMSHLINGI